MDILGNYPRDKAFDPFSVMLFKALQVVAFLFFIAPLRFACLPRVKPWEHLTLEIVVGSRNATVEILYVFVKLVVRQH